MMVSKLVFFPCAAHNTRVVWAWTWASRNAQMTSPNPHHHAAAELHTVQTHCHPVHGSVSLTRTHARTHMHTPAVPKLNATFSFCIHFRVLSFSCFWQVLPIMFSTAQRGSKSPLLPATRAPCWAQTEVLCLLVKYSQHIKWLLKYDYWSLSDQTLRGAEFHRLFILFILFVCIVFNVCFTIVELG